MKRIATCCFTGHRPEKLNCSAEIVINKLRDAIEDAFSDGFTEFITGMSRGVDIWAAEAVLELRKDFPHIRLICAIPYEGFESEWDVNWKEKFYHIISSADETHYIEPKYSKSVYQIRNEWMVDHASMLIAGYTGAAGGTRNTIEYAKNQVEFIIKYLNL